MKQALIIMSIIGALSLCFIHTATAGVLDGADVNAGEKTKLAECQVATQANYIYRGMIASPKGWFYKNQSATLMREGIQTALGQKLDFAAMGFTTQEAANVIDIAIYYARKAHLPAKTGDTKPTIQKNVMSFAKICKQYGWQGMVDASKL